jgi:NTP pyrophosphatase (non-canonical NTP hydrolase)
MAKQGLNYYNVDTDRYADRRIKRLKHAFGCSGMAVYDYLLCEVYRDRGCFLVWDEDTAFDVAEYFGLKVNTVKEIVTYCGAVGLFNTELLSRGMITSEAIQNRYLEMANRARRQNIAIPEEIQLFTEELPKLTEETQEITQVFHKVNKSKVNNNKLSLCNAHTCAGASEREKILYIFFFEKNFINPNEEVERFINHYEANGWCRNNSSVPVKDKMALARAWKPQKEGIRFPHYFNNWLKEVYWQAMTTEPDNAGMIMQADRCEETGNFNITLYCTREQAELIERNIVPSSLFKLSYRVIN